MKYDMAGKKDITISLKRLNMLLYFS